MTTEPMPAVVTQMLDVLAQMTDAQEHMQCVEAVAVADVFTAAGRHRDAEQFIQSHALGDDDGTDEHHTMYHELRGTWSCRECEPDNSDSLVDYRKEQPDG